MLGKLIKHEWKSVYKLNSIIVIALLAVTVLGCLTLQAPFVTELFSENAVVDDAQAIIVALMGMAGFMVFVLMVIGATYGVIIYQGAHFYKSMYSEQGYLTHTLPVKPHQLLVSKLLVSGVWIFLVYAAVILSVVALISSLMMGITNGLNTEIELAEFKMVMSMILEEIGFQETHMLITICILFIVSPFSSIMMVFGALTIGQLSKKHKLLMGIVAYFAISMITSIVSSIIQMISSVYYTFKGMEELSMEYMNVTYDSALIVTCLIAVVLYFISYHIIKKKLNMA